MANKSLASRLKNRVEIWKKELVSLDIGDSYDAVFYKKVWADIVPVSSSVKNGDAETISTETKLKIIMRKVNISQEDIIKYKNFDFEVEYILENFDGKGYIEVYCKLIKG